MIFFLYDMLDTPLENWPYSKINKVEQKRNILEFDSIIIDLGSWYYKQINVMSPKASEAIACFQKVFSEDKEAVGDFKVFEGIQRYKYYEDVDVKLELSENSFECWRIFPNAPGTEDDNKELRHRFIFKELLRWSATNDKLLLTFNDWIDETTVVITTTQPEKIIDSINQIFNKLLKQLKK